MNYDISKFIPYYPDINSDTFNTKISNKHEFRYPLVGLSEKFPRPRGDLMAHQIVISRMMSSRTPYDGMLLLHEMGTGKTCSAVAIMEQIRSENSKFNRYIYVSSSTDLGNNFEAEFKNVCTKGEYDDIKLDRKNIIKMTYQSFIKRYTNKGVRGTNILENTVVIIDEIHNQRRNSDVLRSIIQSGKNIKTILLSGTPMTDSPSGIADIMNIIIPRDEDKLPTDEDFYNNLDEIKIMRLRKAFKGRISYIKSIPVDNVTKTYIGSKFDFKHYIVSPSVMSEYQYEVYKDALKADIDETSSAAYSNSRMASNFVSPDKKYRIEDIDKKYNLNLGPSSKHEDMLKILSKYSQKYADSVRMILDPVNKDKTVFVFNTSVNGGGLNMFAQILRRFGFDAVNEKRAGVDSLSNIPKKQRYILLTGEGGIDKAALVNRFNQDNNKNGDYIKVVLASDAISEGYTFKNIQIIDIHSPWFQFAKISQAIARGIRFGSHRALLEDVEKVNVNVYLRVSVTPEGKSDGRTRKGIDMDTYKTAEDKDVIVKKIEHIIKEESIDSRINYTRNERPDSMDGSRECDYMKCKYKPFPTEPDPKQTVHDYSTYQLYYNDQTEIINIITGLFQNELVMNFDDIVDKTSTDELLITSALHEMITSNIQLRPSLYLREQNNMYFLSDNMFNTSSRMDMYYINNTIEELVNDDVSEPVNSKVIGLLNDISITSVSNLITKLVQEGFTSSDKEIMIENVISNNIITKKPTIQSTQVIELFTGLFGNIGDTYYSWYTIQDCKTLCRKMSPDTGIWMDCTEDDENKVIIPYLEQTVTDVIQRASVVGKGASIVYYGLFNFDELQIQSFDKTKRFKILTKDTTVDITDKRVAPKGQMCDTFLNEKKKYEDIRDKIGIDEDDIEYVNLWKNVKKDKLPKKKKGCEFIESRMVSKNLIIREVTIKRPLCLE